MSSGCIGYSGTSQIGKLQFFAFSEHPEQLWAVDLRNAAVQLERMLLARECVRNLAEKEFDEFGVEESLVATFELRGGYVALVIDVVYRW